MVLQIVQVEETGEAFEQLARAERDGFESPLEPIFTMLFPLASSSITDRETSIKEAGQRRLDWHRSDPASRWLKVVDNDDLSGKIWGAANWKIFDKNPYAEAKEEQCVWIPEGEDRVVAKRLTSQFVKPRMQYMQRPHLFLNILFTVPDCRRNGVCSRLLQWGIEEADKRGYETYIDASEMGKQQYQKFGFITGDRHTLTTTPFEQTPRLKELEQMWLPSVWWPMYRPVRGIRDETTKLPWQNVDHGD